MNEQYQNYDGPDWKRPALLGECRQRGVLLLGQYSTPILRAALIAHDRDVRAIRSKRCNERPRIVCLCGSTRFVEQFNEWGEKFTLNGWIVLGIEIVTTQSRAEDPQLVVPETKAMLDELHLCKIDLADEIMVLNVDGYIGESTSVEISYAHYLGEPINYLED